MKAFVAKRRQLIRDHRRKRIVNIDAPNWRRIAAGFKTWAATGAELIHCTVDNDDKQGVTLIAAITAYYLSG
jgi:hypothetical protein